MNKQIVRKGIHDEQEAIKLYKKMLSLDFDYAQKLTIQDIMNDEIKH